MREKLTTQYSPKCMQVETPENLFGAFTCVDLALSVDVSGDREH